MPRKRREGGRNLTEEHCVNPLTLANFTQKPALIFKSMHPPSFRPANRIQKPKPDTQATPGSKCGKHTAMRPGGQRHSQNYPRRMPGNVFLGAFVPHLENGRDKKNTDGALRRRAGFAGGASGRRNPHEAGRCRQGESPRVPQPARPMATPPAPLPGVRRREICS